MDVSDPLSSFCPKTIGFFTILDRNSIKNLTKVIMSMPKAIKMITIITLMSALNILHAILQDLPWPKTVLLNMKIIDILKFMTQLYNFSTISFFTVQMKISRWWDIMDFTPIKTDYSLKTSMLKKKKHIRNTKEKN